MGGRRGVGIKRDDGDRMIEALSTAETRSVFCDRDNVTLSW